MSGGRSSTPVHLLTGFLGSGKTTLLQRMLADPALADTAVLINEYGDIALDHHLLDRIDDTVVLLKSGCLCCTVRGEVADALLNLHSLRARGVVDPFKRVVIETSGLADPYPVLSTIRAHPVLRSHFSVGGTVTTVDAMNGQSQLASRLEAIRQVAAAEVMVITKADLVPPETVSTLTAKLSSINPAAEVRFAADPDIANFLAPATWRPSQDPPGGHGVQYHTSGDVKTLSLLVEDDIDWTAFAIWLTALLNRHGDKIFRVKGILNVAGEDRPVAIHGVQRLVHPPVHMSAWPEGVKQSRLVFIFEKLDPAAIQESLMVFNALSSPTAAREIKPFAAVTV